MTPLEPMRHCSECRNWSTGTVIEALLSVLRSGSMGAPAYPSLALFKALLLQQSYGLSDQTLRSPGVTPVVSAFSGPVVEEPVPDHSTLWRFREQLATSELAERTFALITAQIEKSGFVLKRFTLIHASLIRSAVNPPEPSDSPLPAYADCGPPASWLKALTIPTRPVPRRMQNAFGYKMHVAMYRQPYHPSLAFTPANVNDTVSADTDLRRRATSMRKAYTAMRAACD